MNQARVTAEEFEALFKRCVESTIAKAQEEVRGASLPSRVRFELVALNKSGRESTAEEIVGALYANGAFPRIVDVAVRGVTADATVVWVRPSEHGSVTDLAETWNEPPGMGPFKAVGLLIPSHLWERPRPFSLNDLREAAPSWAMDE